MKIMKIMKGLAAKFPLKWNGGIFGASSRPCGRDTDEASKLARKESKRSLVSRISTFPADMDETWKADIDILQAETHLSHI